MNINYPEHQLSKEEINTRTRQLIQELYNCCYTRNITVDKLYPLGYKLSLPMSCDETPFVVAIEAEGEQFFKYLKKALQESALSTIKFFTLSLSQEVANPTLDYVKGNYDTTHRVQQDDITYVVENNDN